MYLIDKTYFIKSINVPNIAEHNCDASIDLEISIDKYARQFLQETLGNILFNELNRYITNGVLNLNAPQKWLNFVNGCNYDIDQKTYTWKGIKFEEGWNKTSILAHFTYVNHFQNSINSSLGQIAILPKNGVVVNSTSHLVEIWNEFIEMYQGKNYNLPIGYKYKGTNFIDYFGANENNGYVSYLTFLLDKKTDYPNVPANYLENKNSLGL